MRATAYRCVTWGAIGLAFLLSAKTASAQYKNNAYLEAECPTSSSGSCTEPS